MKKLSIRKRDGAFEIGHVGRKHQTGRKASVMVNALDKQAALRKGKELLRNRLAVGA